MILKDAAVARPLFPWLTRAGAPLWAKLERPRWIGAVVTLLAAAAAFHAGGEAYRARWQILAAPKVPGNVLRGLTAEPARLQLDISYRDYQKLAYKRMLAFDRGKLYAEDDSYVPATVSVDGDAVRGRVRLKGEGLDHLKGDTWSLRVRLRDGQALFGMRRFSIQTPRRSGSLKEWIFYRLLEHEDLIALRYDYVDVTLNGEHKGIYALEESFTSALLDHNRRREGPLLKFDERLFVLRNEVADDFQSQTDLFHAADVLVFQTGRTFEDPFLRSAFLAGRQALADFRAGRRAASETFDIERTAKILAVVDLLNCFHAVRWKNARFYFNPLTSRLELIGYNAYGNEDFLPLVGDLNYQLWRQDRFGPYPVREWIGLFYSDPVIRERYFHHLERLTSPGYLERFFAEVAPELEAKLAIVQRGNPFYHWVSARYFANRDTLATILRPEAPITATLVADAPELEVQNPLAVPVEVLGLRCGATEMPTTGDRTVLDSLPGQSVTAVRVRLATGGDVVSCRDGDATVSYRIPGTERVLSAPVAEAAEGAPWT